MTPIPQRRLLLLAALLLVAGALTLYLPQHLLPVDAASFLEGTKVSYGKARAHWEKRIASQGGTQAHAELLGLVEGFTASQAHVMAHIFGETLYAKEGIGSIGTCDERLFYGCWHQFVGQALAQEGLSILPRLTALCSASMKPAACAHGVGHGIVGHIGYSIDDLKRALALCAEVESRSSRNGCTEGAFMEYNLQELTATDEMAVPRALSAENVYEPCVSVAAAYASACGFELPVWWSVAQADSLSQKYVTEWMGEKCAEAPLTPLRRGCFQGIGFMLALSEGAERTAQLCAFAAKDERDRVLCLAGAASGLPVHNRDELVASCSEVGLEGAAHDYCVAYGRAEEVAKDSVPVPNL